MGHMFNATGEDIIEEHIRPAAYAIANQIDMDLADLYRMVPWYVDAQANADLKDVTLPRQILFDNGVPMDPTMLHFMIDGALEAGFLTLTASMPWRVRQLSRMPNGDDPNRVAGDPIEEPEGPNDNLTVRKFRELWNRSARLWKVTQSAQHRLGRLAETARGRRIIPPDVLQPLEELPPGRRGEQDPHETSSPSRRSASSRTLASV